MSSRLRAEGLARADLGPRTEAVLNRGGWGNPDVLLVRAGGRRAVVKDYRPRSPLVRATLGRLLAAREIAAYRALVGHPAVPRFLGRIDRDAFAVEYRAGTRLSRKLASQLPPGFVNELAEAVAGMHARGVTHLDLRHRSNALLGEDGHPVLIDFASAVCFRRGSLAARFVLPIFAYFDRRALRKWIAKLGAEGSAADAPARGSPSREASS